MDWLDTKIEEFSAKYTAQGFTIEPHQAVIYHEASNTLNTAHLLPLRATRGTERHLLFFSDLDAPHVLKSANDHYKNALSKIRRRTQTQLDNDERNIESVIRLKDTPKTYSYLHDPTKERITVPEKIIAMHWHESRVNAIYREMRVIEAMLPMAAEIDKIDWMTTRGLRDLQTQSKMDKKEAAQFFNYAAQYAAIHHNHEYKGQLHVHLYNGLPDAVEVAFANTLRRQRIPFALHWNDKHVNLSGNVIKFEKEFRIQIA